MRNALSLIEFLFVIVLIGMLSGIGFYLSQPDYARQDAHYALLKLKEARYRAIAYQSPNDSGIEEGCVTLTKEALSDNEAPTHEIKSDSITTTPNSITTVCFDNLGRPHDGNSTQLDTLIDTKVDIVFKYTSNSDKNTTILLFQQSGYVIIF
ncbi:MAG: hypothetical protein Q8K81_08365 [Sulfuricurvum sp.]|nr:hypothetical protein [Sulfuricurvum sp.]